MTCRFPVAWLASEGRAHRGLAIGSTTLVAYQPTRDMTCAALGEIGAISAIRPLHSEADSRSVASLSGNCLRAACTLVPRGWRQHLRKAYKATIGYCEPTTHQAWAAPKDAAPARLVSLDPAMVLEALSRLEKHDAALT